MKFTLRTADEEEAATEGRWRKHMEMTGQKRALIMTGALRSNRKNFVLASLVIIVFAFCFCKIVYGETFSHDCESMKDQLAKANSTKLREFSKDLDRFLKIKDRTEKITTSLDAAYTGDISNNDQDRLQSMNIGSVVEKKAYPFEFKFKADAMFSLKPKKSQDQVTNFVVNLNYYILPWLMTYGFVERFTDTFMSIKERYETGGGIKMELNLLDSAPAVQCLDNEFTPADIKGSIKKQYEDKKFIECTLPKDIKDLSELLKTDGIKDILKEAEIDEKALDEFIARLETEIENLKSAQYKHRSKISLGLAITAMSDMEQAAITYDVIDINTNQTLRTADYVPIPTQRFRIVFRPSIDYRINELLTLYSHVYFKEPLGPPLYDNGKRDWRYDGVVDAKLDLPKDPSWGGDVSVILEYQRHYDNAPPYIPDKDQSPLISPGQKLSKTIADYRHEIVMVKIRVTF